jgi:hypothetical protein
MLSISYETMAVTNLAYCDGFAQSIKLRSQKTPLLGKHIPVAVNNTTSVA